MVTHKAVADLPLVHEVDVLHFEGEGRRIMGEFDNNVARKR